MSDARTCFELFRGLCSKGDPFCHIVKIVQAVRSVVDVSNDTFIRKGGKKSRHEENSGTEEGKPANWSLKPHMRLEGFSMLAVNQRAWKMSARQCRTEQRCRK